jgi:hypothetical protein
VIDFFFGISLAWIGAAWIWLPNLAAIAGIFPAVMVTAVLAGRKRLVEERAGYVKWAEPRRRWERRNLWLAIAAGVALLGLGVGLFAVESAGTKVFESVGPAILAWLLAIMAIGVAFLISAWRMLAYAALLVVTGALAANQDANPGWPLLVAGIVITATGAAMLSMYLRRHPRVGNDD